MFFLNVGVNDVGRTRAVIVAAGRGERMGQGEKKQFRILGTKPLYQWSLQAFHEVDSIDEIVVVTGADDVTRVQSEIQGAMFPKVVDVVAGGATRQDSVFNGLIGLDDNVQWIVIHDGVRPFVGAELIQSVLDAAKQWGAAISALPVKETIKEVGHDDAMPAGVKVKRTPDRSLLWAAQTPQAFSRSILLDAYRRFGDGTWTDDSSLVEATGVEVAIVAGHDQNIKITTESDFDLAKKWVTGPTSRIATGFGFDVHRLVPGRPLILGGVSIPYDKGLDGHSDADVLTHAVMDALLGAASLGDIGRLFPNDDPAYKDADSLKLLERVRDKVGQSGGRILHVDAFVSAERPRLSPVIDEMRRNLARAMGIQEAWVNVKAGTGEGAGPVGTGEVIEARAVATIERFE